VPITGQTFGVLLVGMLLGSRRGALSLLLYLLEGAAACRSSRGGGEPGPPDRPDRRYLWSYPLAAYFVGRLTERGWDRSPLRTALAMLLGSVLIWGWGRSGSVTSPAICAPHFCRDASRFWLGTLCKTALAAALCRAGGSG
jgi:biotin transport system substrate-specific component